MGNRIDILIDGLDYQYENDGWNSNLTLTSFSRKVHCLIRTAHALDVEDFRVLQ